MEHPVYALLALIPLIVTVAVILLVWLPAVSAARGEIRRVAKVIRDAQTETQYTLEGVKYDIQKLMPKAPETDAYLAHVRQELRELRAFRDSAVETIRALNKENECLRGRYE